MQHHSPSTLLGQVGQLLEMVHPPTTAQALVSMQPCSRCPAETAVRPTHNQYWWNPQDAIASYSTA